MTTTKLVIILSVLTVLSACQQPTERIVVAVAANFAQTFKQLAQQYNASHPVLVTPVIASSGLLLSQIQNGAPYDLYLSANTSHVQHLTSKGIGIDHKTAVYAVGQLALWIPDYQSNDCVAFLSESYTEDVAIANPRFAPYGIKAEQVIKSMQGSQFRVITAANVSMVYSMVQDRHVGAGFVAVAQTVQNKSTGCVQKIDEFGDINQSMLLLDQKAEDFFDFLLSSEAQSVIKNNGYL